MRKNDDGRPVSPACELIGCFGTRWALLTLLTLYERGTLRFNELWRSVPGGISERMLASTLRELERAELVERRVYPEVPPRVEYTVTSYVDTLIPIVHQLVAWAEAHAARRSPSGE